MPFITLFGSLVDNSKQGLKFNRIMYEQTYDWDQLYLKYIFVSKYIYGKICFGKMKYWMFIFNWTLLDKFIIWERPIHESHWWNQKIWIQKYYFLRKKKKMSKREIYIKFLKLSNNLNIKIVSTLSYVRYFYTC